MNLSLKSILSAHPVGDGWCAQIVLTDGENDVTVNYGVVPGDPEPIHQQIEAAIRAGAVPMLPPPEPPPFDAKGYAMQRFNDLRQRAADSAALTKAAVAAADGIAAGTITTQAQVDAVDWPKPIF